MRIPLVSVVTPFYNTAPYLAECIESVLGQSFPDFEYILADNCSTDGSTEIAESYARRDCRVRLVRCEPFLPQIANYNRGLTLTTSESKYLKIVEADNFLLPECLRLMVEAFERTESLGLVSSYWLRGNVVYGSGYPFPKAVISGKEWAACYLRGAPFVFGSPTQVMYRSAIADRHQPFFNPSVLHADTDKCLQILRKWDFGFIHQVLSFSRVDNESITTAHRGFADYALDRYMTARRYGPTFLGTPELQSFTRESKRLYYRALAPAALRLGVRPVFWRYHIEGLRTVQERLDWSFLAVMAAAELIWAAGNPAMTFHRALRWCGRRIKSMRKRRG